MNVNLPRRLAILSAAFVLGFGVLPVADAGVIVGPVVNPANGHSYYLLTESSWQDSEAEAVSLGGHLATINDDAEQNFVFSTFGSYGGVNRSLWIGLNDAAQEGNFVWVSGETPSYTHWLPGQPDNNGDEDYVHMLRTGNAFQVTPSDWNDLASPNSPFYSAFSPIEGVVETVPEPAALVMLGSGIIGALVAWRRRSPASVS